MAKLLLSLHDQLENKCSTPAHGFNLAKDKYLALNFPQMIDGLLFCFLWGSQDVGGRFDSTAAATDLNFRRPITTSKPSSSCHTYHAQIKYTHTLVNARTHASNRTHTHTHARTFARTQSQSQSQICKVCVCVLVAVGQRESVQ